ncbi:hypothetical protein Agub_g10026 [Astrephomene gubernaculifera]|uniref:Uncharacterized protein n=1 Tax=Astrephomene gubernaculifera TaxID=47775 RepID=A0AAD3DUN7_9CHLO|nr:hypothetical protein Agub_g10026 [Astrephomene gubernaculifera]
MSKRGASEREGYTPSQSNLRKARVEVRRVDAIQVLMAAARARNMQPAQQAQQQQLIQQNSQLAAAAADAAAANGADPSTALPTNPQQLAAQATGASAPCTHCGTVLPVSADSCCLRQCCGCLDVFCSLCSVLDYEEREDRVFCLSCLEDQTACARGGGNRGRTSMGGGGAPTPNGGLSLPIGGTTGRWGQLDALGMGGPARSPFPCTRTPQPGQGQPGSRTPGSAVYSNRSHRSFSALLAYGGAGS